MLDYSLLVVFILSVWVIQLFAFLGVGLLVGRTFTQEGLTVRRALNLTWIGWATCIGFLQLLHLVAPIQVSAQVCIVTAAVVGFFLARKSLGSLRDDFKQQVGANLRWLLILPMLLVVAILAACADWHYDSGNYHQQSVLWASQSPVVPGLGNLHVRLAFNSSLHLYFALLDVGLLKDNAAHFGNSFLMALALISLLSRCLLREGQMNAGSFAAWLVLPGIVALASPLNIATLITDPAVTVLEVIICFLLVELFERKQTPAFEEKYFTLVILATIGVTVKLSIILFSTSAILIATGLLIRRQGQVLKTKAFWVVSVGLVLMMVGWVVHGIILSGYPLFPSPLFPLPVEWRVPMKTTVELNGWIRAWPRLVQDNSMIQSYEDILGSWDWLKPWSSSLIRNVWGFKIPMAILTFGICLAGCLLFRQKERANLMLGLKSTFFVVGMNCVLLVFLFFYLPDIRFAWSLIWVTVSLVLATSLMALEEKRRVIALQAVAILSLALVAKSFHGSLKWLEAHWTPPENVTAVGEFKAQTGLILNVPKNGEQCFKAALPCTPYPSPLLSKREAGGFKVELFSEDAIVGWYTKEMPWEQMKP